MSSDNDQIQGRPDVRSAMRSAALDRAIRKRAEGAPTYTVSEAAALLSISQEYLYRLIQAEAFPVVRMRLSGRNGRYVIAAKAIEQLLDGAVSGGADELASTTQGFKLAGGAA
ncbi:hypothetical protein PSU4_27900 [Pseudonocardia sulfidoxydans NBRC 16205]|uniref:Helix-turn-helix domain-containing protein n=1 Tax=Pseudonocardia sulfidoxydans NBRC 16205 TaxID=1223511 RepID=A0A511DGC3_9PSEU|nr:helix-turn-helix domain-containing protein [Pseudonocardia sulfidoxydans]GEL23836.1 hypothetical protein PSU4_27900 [Pseudonocardia sulfidoxydans NBRC 16205]